MRLRFRILGNSRKKERKKSIRKHHETRRIRSIEKKKKKRADERDESETTTPARKKSLPIRSYFSRTSTRLREPLQELSSYESKSEYLRVNDAITANLNRDHEHNTKNQLR